MTNTRYRPSPSLDTGALASARSDSKHELPCALAVSWLREVEENGVQEAVHAGKRPCAFVDD